MNILIDIGHPAHVHLFKHLSLNLKNNGHNVNFTVRSGEKEADLLKSLGLKYKVIGSRKKSILGKVLGIFSFTTKILIFSSFTKADIYISHSSMYAGYVAFIRRKPHIALEDSGNMEQLRFSVPVSTLILIPDVLEINLDDKQISYRGYHELAYLGPKYFDPDRNIKALLGIKETENYCVLRFSAWKATHDLGQGGLNDEEKNQLIKYLSNYFKVFISSEKQLPSNLREHEITLEPEKLHDIIASADMVISEGATIASEAGVLGVPSLYVNSIVRCYNEDLAKYGLVHNFRSPEGVLEKIKEILSVPNYKEVYKSRRDLMLKDKIDVTALLTWFVESYPESADEMRLDPDYQFRFK